MQGKLIVLDGADGSGKATQATLLVEHMRAAGQAVETLDFPRYTENHFGKLIRECLDGKHGDFMSLPPKIAATLYAVDRFESRNKLCAWLESGTHVVLDRYVSANMLHQGAKIDDHAERVDFLNWLRKTEYEVFGVPQPDLVLCLDIPHAVRRKLKAEAVAAGKHGGKADVAEQDDAHQAATERAAKQMVASLNDWQTINCVQDESLRSREDIAAEIYERVQKVI